jgi:hypothetical protein
MLNANGARPLLVVDGKCGPLTWAAWQKYIGALVVEKVGSPDTRPGPLPPVPMPMPRPGPAPIDIYSEKPPIWREPWFWFVAASAFVLIIAFKSKKR